MTDRFAARCARVARALPLHLALLALVAGLAAPSALAQVPQTSIHPNKTGQTLIDALRADYAPSQTLGYDLARDELYRYLDTRDGVLIGVYGGYSVDIPAGQDPSSTAYQNGSGLSAEHTWPQSKGAGNEPQKSDMHHLYPVKQTINSARSNHPYDDVPDSDTDTWYVDDTSTSFIPSSNVDGYSESDGAFPSSSTYSARFEPRESHKGNAARAVFYYVVVYSNTISDGSFFEAQKDELLDWHEQDAVDANEYDRSQWIAMQQGTNNPFVLDTTLVRRAFGSPDSGGDGSGGGSDGGTSTDALFAETFDDATQYTITQGTDATDGSDNYFTRTDGSDIDKTYGGASGAFFAAQDIDDGQVLGSTPGRLTWTGIDVSGVSDLQFSGRFGEVLDGSGDIDDSDYIRVQYRMDGGAWRNLLAFENDGASYNTSFYEDTDFNGIGDGSSITSSAGTMVSFTKSIPDTGTTLDLRVTVSVNSGDEDVAMDDFEVTGNGGTDGDGSSGGRVYVSEIMQNPSDVWDSRGEYFEVYNPGASAVDLNGWTVRDDDADSHTIGASVTVPAQGYAVLCRNGKASQNGGVPCDYVYSGIALANGADEVVLVDGSGAEVSRVAYDGGSVWPDPSGASMIFTGDASDTPNDGSLWTPATSRSGFTRSGSDTGTPGVSGKATRLADSDSGASLRIRGPYPNPAGASGAAVTLSVPTAQDVTVAVYDLLGRRVAVPLDRTLRPGGTARIALPTGRLRSGTYFVRITGTTFQETRRVTVVR